jgi:DNA-directed RNA polymerase subunit RPC12/RpoP
MEFIPIKTFDSYISANIWLGRFLDGGIDCYLKDENSVTLNPVWSNAIGGIKLCVRDEQVEEAKKIMRQMEFELLQSLKCPKCGAANVQYISKPTPTNWLSAIATWLLGSYAISAKEVYHCFTCGYEFDTIPEEETL